MAAPTTTPIRGIGVTVSDRAPDTPSIVAVTTTVPVAIPCNTPVSETVATRGSELDHVAVVPGMTNPEASRPTAVSSTISPTHGDGVGLSTVTEVGAGPLQTVAAGGKNTSRVMALVCVTPYIV